MEPRDFFNLCLDIRADVGFDIPVGNDDMRVDLQYQSNILFSPADENYFSAIAIQEGYHTSKEYLYPITLIQRVQDNGQIFQIPRTLHEKLPQPLVT